MISVYGVSALLLKSSQSCVHLVPSSWFRAAVVPHSLGGSLPWASESLWNICYTWQCSLSWWVCLISLVIWKKKLFACLFALENIIFFSLLAVSSVHWHNLIYGLVYAKQGCWYVWMGSPCRGSFAQLSQAKQITVIKDLILKYRYSIVPHQNAASWKGSEMPAKISSMWLWLLQHLSLFQKCTEWFGEVF